MNQLFLITLLLVSLLSACVSPATRLEQQAAQSGLSRQVISATAGLVTSMPLVTYRSSGLEGKKFIYVYIEGDGRPWDKGRWPASDPNTQASTVLPLMAATGGLYVARPCYAWSTVPIGCDARWWTSGRYSAEVLALMDQALESIAKQYPKASLVLVGHSGGGNLAMLLASKRAGIAAVVTIAGNLDHRAWTQAFGYLPLSGSLNSIDYPLPPNLIRWHLVGGKDRVMPERLLAAVVAKDPKARALRYPGFSHNCCWASIWPDVVEQLERVLAAQAID